MYTGTLEDIEILTEVAKVIKRSQKLIAFTGAGMSAESEVPTFRDPGGLWDQYDPDEIATAGGLLSYVNKNPHEVKTMISGLLNIFENAHPNAGHYALTELQKMGLLSAVITQNIDNLHSEAGTKRVFEVHGNIFRFRCLKCSSRFNVPKDQVINKYKELIAEKDVITLSDLFNSLPNCSCGGKARFDVVLFGEAVQNMPEATSESANADVVLTLGTSGVVYPAAYIPIEAKRNGAIIIEINPHDTSFDTINSYLIKAKTGEALPKILEILKKL